MTVDVSVEITNPDDTIQVEVVSGIPGAQGPAGGGGGGAVDSVNGETGTVVLDATDVGADAAGTAAALVDDLSGVTNAPTARTNLGLGTAATQASSAFDAAGAAAAAQAASQPLDSALTAIAALTTTPFGRAFLALADAAAGRTALGLGTAAVAATGDFDAAGAAAAAQAASQPLDSDLTAIAALSTTPFGRGLLASANVAALWVTLSGGAGADVSMNSHKLTNVTDPGSAQDAATKAYVDANAGGSASVGVPRISPSGTIEWGLPGLQVVSVATLAVLADRASYYWIKVDRAVTLNAWQLEVTAGPASAANLAVRVYAADSEMQPSGAALYDSGSVAVASGFTGTKSATGLSVSLPVGMYCVGVFASVAMTFRAIRAGQYLVDGLGANALISTVAAVETYSATAANPGTKWTSVTAAATPMLCPVVWRWTP